MATWKEFMRSWLKRGRARTSARLNFEMLESREVPSITTAQTPDAWVPVGPVGITVPTADPGADLQVGAVEHIAVDPFNSNHVLIAAVNGGIWSTNNYATGNPVWTTSTDQLPSLAISTVAFSPTVPGVVYAGTGSFTSGGLGLNFSAGVLNPGDGGPPVGLYKSTDGGTTWAQVAASQFAGLRIRSVVPTALTNGDTILVASHDTNGGSPSGIYRSDNAGSTWTRLSGSNGLPNLGDTSLVPDLGNPNRFYAFAFGGSGAGVYMLDTTAGNKTWVNISNNLPASVASGARVLLTTTAAGVDPVYAAVQDASGILTGVYRAVPFGSTFIWTAIGPGGLPPDVNQGGQGTVHSAIVADPTSDHIVYVAGDRNAATGEGNVARGDALADTWTTMTLQPAGGLATPGTTTPLNPVPQPTTTPHADTRWLTFAGNDTLLLGGDGGIYGASNPRAENDLPPVWTPLDGNLQISELYMADIYNSNTPATTDDLFMAAAQDNGESEGLLGGRFNEVAGGDGTIARADSVNGYRYYSSQGFFLTRVNPDGSVVQPATTVVGGGVLDGNSFFNPAFALNQGDSNLMLVGGSFSDLYFSADHGDTFTSVGGGGVGTPVPNVTGLPLAVAYGTNQIRQAAYVATDDGNISQSFDISSNQGNFKLTNFKTVAKGVPATYIAMDPNNPLVAYAVTNQGVYRTSDGSTWTDISGNLPSLVAKGGLTKLFSILEFGQGTITSSDDTLLVGGFGGVYVATPPTAGPVVWSKFGAGLPNVIVTDLRYDSLSDTVVAGTYGRGEWKTKVNLTVFVTGNAAANVMSITPDPAVSGNFIVSDGLGNTKSFSDFDYRRVIFSALGGADTVVVGSANPNVGGNTALLPVEIDVDGGGTVGDQLVYQDGADPNSEIGTLTTTSFGKGTGDTIFGLGFSTYTGFGSGTVQVVMGTSSSDQLKFDDTATAADATYTVTSSNITRSLGGTYNYSGVESLGLTGGPGKSTFLIQSVPGALSLDGGGGIDSASFSGTSSDELITAHVVTTTQVDLTGFANPVSVSNLENFAYDGGAGVNQFDLVNETGLPFGSAADPIDGIVFGPTGQFSGLLRVGTDGFAISNINGGVNVSGAGDTMMVLGTSAAGLQSAYGEAVLGDGRDVMNISESGVNLQSNTGDPLLSVKLAAGTFATLYVAGGNEAGPGGDTMTVTPSSTVNIIVDGMAPSTTPGDQVVILGGGPITRTYEDNPMLTRYTNGDGASAGVRGFERVSLPDAGISSGMIAVASDAGPETQVQVYDRLSHVLRYQITPFEGFFAGATVASGDVNGDGIADLVVGAGPGGGPRVSIFDGFDGTLLANFFAYESTFRGGVNVSAADFNKDGHADIILGTGVGGGPRVRVLSGLDLSPIRDVFVYPSTFRGGVNVTAGDFNGDGTPDLITSAGIGGGPQVVVLSGVNLQQLASFFAFDPNSRTGFFIGSGDVNGDGFGDVIAGDGAGDPAHVKVISGLTHQPVADFYVNDPLEPGTAIPSIQFDSGVRVAASDVNGDGIDDVITAKGPGSAPTIRTYQIAAVNPQTHAVFPTLQEIQHFDAFGGAFASGLYVGGSD
jgi:hypothetical protein